MATKLRRGDEPQPRGSALRRLIDQSVLPATINAAASVERGIAIGADAMREQPLAGSLAAAGIGFVLGYLLAPARRLRR